MTDAERIERLTELLREVFTFFYVGQPFPDGWINWCAEAEQFLHPTSTTTYGVLETAEERG